MGSKEGQEFKSPSQAVESSHLTVYAASGFTSKRRHAEFNLSEVATFSLSGVTPHSFYPVLQHSI